MSGFITESVVRYFWWLQIEIYWDDSRHDQLNTKQSYITLHLDWQVVVSIDGSHISKGRAEAVQGPRSSCILASSIRKEDQMKKLIICPKESGNTWKVCQYIASNSDIELISIAKNTQYDLPNSDVIIVASGVYGNHVHKNIVAWIDSIGKNTIASNTKVYLFLTWFGRGNSDKTTFNEVKRLLGEKGIQLEDDYMKCFGKGMAVIRTSHPSEEDCNNVLAWAKEL